MKAPTTQPPDFRDLRFERHVAHLHSLGARAVAELLREVGQRTMHMTTIEQAVERYAQLDPKAVRTLGADVFPSRPTLRMVGGRRHG